MCRPAPALLKGLRDCVSLTVSHGSRGPGGRRPQRCSHRCQNPRAQSSIPHIPVRFPPAVAGTGQQMEPQRQFGPSPVTEPLPVGFGAKRDPQTKQVGDASLSPRGFHPVARFYLQSQRNVQPVPFNSCRPQRLRFGGLKRLELIWNQ